MSQIIFAEEGWADYLFWQSQDRKTLKRINQLISSIERDGPMQGIGKPERLKYQACSQSSEFFKSKKLKIRNYIGGVCFLQPLSSVERAGTLLGTNGKQSSIAEYIADFENLIYGRFQPAFRINSQN